MPAAQAASRGVEAEAPLRLDRVALFVEPAPEAPLRRLAEFALSEC